MSKATNKSKVAAIRLTSDSVERIHKMAELERISPSNWMRNCINEELGRKEALCRTLREGLANDGT